MKNLPLLKLPAGYNYVACFLTFDCTMGCSYCINLHEGSRRQSGLHLTGAQWVEGLDRLELPPDIPVTLQGGEPSLHPDFIWIINNIKKGLNIDILSNLAFDVNGFIDAVDPVRLRRNAPYPSIRISYHPDYMDIDRLLSDVGRLQKAGFSIGVFSIRIPGREQLISSTALRCAREGIDFRTKELLGEYGGRMHGTYRYPDAVSSKQLRRCRCRTTELLIGPDGRLYRCHHDLYRDFPAVGQILDPDLQIDDSFRECASYGACNPCDIKVKTDRFQDYGHTSVEIKDIDSKEVSLHP